MNMNAQELVENAQLSATRAVQFDETRQLTAASFYYQDAARILLHAADIIRDEETACIWKKKALEYQVRCREIEETVREAQKAAQQPEDVQQIQRCRFLFSQALDADEAGLREEAVELYSQAVELCIKTRSELKDSDQQQKLGVLARKALDRAEVLKGVNTTAVSIHPEPSAPPEPLLPVHLCGLKADQNKSPTGSLGKTTLNDERPALHRGSSAHLKVVGGSDSYSDEEKYVLLATSRINDRDYVPFMNIDLKERFQYAIPFTDKDGPLTLSPKQKAAFARWVRPSEICDDPVMVSKNCVDPYSIKQTVVSDCSFVASLAIGALYERRFGRRLITSIIFPKNRQKEPVFNPFGKYMIKLHLNGVPRKVIVDDMLPVGQHGELLCSYSTNRNELWISVLEKAYMKVMGGYDFPGSNSNIDLHALTGWIPERKAIRSNEPDFNSDGLFEMLLERFKSGHVLATVATGELSKFDADRAGLVPTHAYAVLDICRVNGVRLFKLKNPWSHLRWRGNYSELDQKHWTIELRNALQFDPDSAAMFDNGVFWIDYESIMNFFDVFYLNWNPQIFQYTYCIHQSWKAGVGPIKDAYNIGDNPQFRLQLDSGSGAVWILLSRHITNIQDFKENQEYITVLVYNTDGKRVYYPHDPPPFIDGVRINSPHYLCKLKLSESSSRRYTLVISQYEKMHTIYYTLRAYATCPIKLEPIGNPYNHTKQVQDGLWKGITAGGCGNHPLTYPNNPCYLLVLESSHNNNQILLDLRGPKQYQIGIDVQTVVLNNPNAPGAFRRKSSGVYRSGFVAFELENVPAGSYEVIPSTFLPTQEGPFILTVKSSCSLKISRLR